MLCLAWLDRAPDEADRARLALIRLLTRLCHAGDLLGVSVAAPPCASTARLAALAHAALHSRQESPRRSVIGDLD
jgi:hypothetical protein